MNAKLVKRMRQHARRLMAGKPERGAIAGDPVWPTLKNDPQTVRGMYRAMRKGFATRSNHG